MNLLSALKTAANSGNKGIVFIQADGAEEKLLYSDLYAKALCALGALQQRGIKAGDELVLQLDDNRSFLIIFWACVLGRIVPVPLSTGVQQDQKLKLFRVWNYLNNPFLACDEEQRKRLETFADDADHQQQYHSVANKCLLASEILQSTTAGKEEITRPEDLAYIQFSSGSTGEPKGVCLTHDNLVCNVADIVSSLAITASDTLLSWMPLTHDMGMIGFHLTGVIKNIQQVSIPTSVFVKRPLIWMEKAASCPASVLYTPNFGLQYFLLAFQKTTEFSCDLSSIRIIVNGAEPISPALCRQFEEALQPHGLREHVMMAAYGLAEASVEVSVSPVHAPIKTYCLDRKQLKPGDKIKKVKETSGKGVNFVDVGYPISMCEVRIADEHDQPLRENIIGHIQIKGRNVTAGYYNNPAATQKLFTDDDFLRTGDIGFLHEGRLVITGRAKNIIIINGQNYYPQDIERIVHDTDVAGLGKVVACGARNREQNKDELLVFVLHKGSDESFVPAVRTIREAVLQQVGIVADKVIPLKQIPKTTSGKVRHFALAEQYLQGEFDNIISFIEQHLYASLAKDVKSDIRSTLLSICKELMGRDDLTAKDDLLTAGLNSILAMQLAGRLKQHTGIDLPVEKIFEHRNILALGKFLEKQAGEQSKPSNIASRILPVGYRDSYPLSPSQRRLWILYCTDKNSYAYNESATYELNGDVHVNIIKKAFNSLALKHDILRTNFIEFDEVPRQVVLEAGMQEVNFHYTDICLHASPAAEADRIRLMHCTQPFNLENDRLYRIVLTRVGVEQYQLTLVMHHIITDDWSGRLLMKEFVSTYTAYCKGQPDPVPAPSIHYVDYVRWADARQQADMQLHKDYWLKEFSGELQALDLPADHRRPVVKKPEGNGIHFSIEPAMLKQLRAFCQEEQVSLYMLLLTGAYVLLSKYTGQHDVVIGAPVSGRQHPDTYDVAGFFVNVLPVRLQFSDEESLQSLLQKVKRKCFDAYAHETFPFDELINELGIQRDPARSPLFDVLLTLSDARPVAAVETMPFNTSMQKLRFAPYTSKYDLSFYFEEQQQELSCTIEYDSNLFHHDRIERMATHYINILKWIAEHKSALLFVVDHIGFEERQKLVHGFNQTEAVNPDVSVAALFQKQALLQPDAIALVCNEHTISYKQLNERSDALAHYLVSAGKVKRNDLVALLLDRSPEMVISILAVWKAGGAYVPIDPLFPQERACYILSHTKCKIIVTDDIHFTACKKLLHDNDISCCCVNAASIPATTPWHSLPVAAGELAYVMYTSGSTGMPKGVEVYQDAVVNTLTSLQTRPGITSSDSFLAVSTYIFDISVAELFLPLVSGAKLLLATTAQVLNTVELKKLAERHQPSIMQATPSLWNMLVESGWQGHAQLTAIACGETLTDDLAAKLLSRVTALWNFYGPTETTIFSTGTQVFADTPITIGKPINNTQVYVMDEHHKLVPQGVFGELYIGGAGVAKGYLHQPQLTNEKFIHNLYGHSGNCYRTGDIGRWLSDGTIELRGRADHQVKLRGFRIELGEIENVIIACKHIHAAVVVIKRDKHGDQHLVCYMIPEADTKDCEELLRNYLRQKLPAYMIPAFFIEMKELPLTPSGKTDRKLLTSKPLEETRETGIYIAPNTVMEKKLAEIWQHILDRPRISITDKFFEIGGHSLKGNRLVNKIYNEWGVEIKLSDIFLNPTIKQQGKLISELEEKTFTYIDLN
ncbi:MAG: amino acid adenylation domain-containing protein [Chitinophagaceae bacterium]